MHEISISQSIKKSTGMMVEMFDGKEVSIEKVGTKVSILVALNITYKEETDFWYPMFHSGLLFSDNIFKSGDESFTYCLVHVVPSSQQRSETKIQVCFSNNIPELTRILALYVGTEFFQAETFSIGNTTTDLSDLAKEAQSLVQKKFILGDFREKVQNNIKNLMENGTTNCLHGCITFLGVMDFPSLHFNDYVMKILVLCFRRVCDNLAKYENKKSYPSLVRAILTCSRYNHCVDASIKSSFDVLLKTRELRRYERDLAAGNVAERLEILAEKIKKDTCTIS